jgi:hypothetical protein
MRHPHRQLPRREPSDFVRLHVKGRQPQWRAEYGTYRENALPPRGIANRVQFSVESCTTNPTRPPTGHRISMHRRIQMLEQKLLDQPISASAARDHILFTSVVIHTVLLTITSVLSPQ